MLKALRDKDTSAVKSNSYAQQTFSTMQKGESSLHRFDMLVEGSDSVRCGTVQEAQFPIHLLLDAAVQIAGRWKWQWRIRCLWDKRTRAQITR